MTDFRLLDDPFEVHEVDHEYLHLPEDCPHEHVIMLTQDGEYWSKCLDCGDEW